MKPIGVQLYTVRNLLNTDGEIAEVLQKIKAMGYGSVQLFGGMELLQRCAKACADVGIPVAGILIDLKTCEESEDGIFALCEKFGISDIGISSSAATLKDLDTYIAKVNVFAKKVREKNLTFSYHNHGHEFIKRENGKSAMERFLEQFDPETVTFMPDTYWIHDGGFDVRHFLELAKGRMKILHLKDLKRTAAGHTFAEIGNGNLWFKGILQTALDCGVEVFVVEQDVCEGCPLESLEQSMKYIQDIWRD